MTDYETVIRKGGTAHGVSDRPAPPHGRVFVTATLPASGGSGELSIHRVQKRRGQRGW